jgi:glutaredoxin
MDKNSILGSGSALALAVSCVIFLAIGIGIGYVIFTPTSAPANATVVASGSPPAFIIDRSVLDRQVDAMEEIQNLNGVSVNLTVVSAGVTADGMIEANVSDETGQQSPMYFTKEYKYLALAVPPVDLVSYAAAMKAQSVAKAQNSSVAKSDRPKVELFVMSYCPYGTQAEKGILPVMQALGNKADFSIKFVYYTMHGYTEAVENTRQYCIEAQQADKYVPYLACFLNASDADGCAAKNGINASLVGNCMNATYAQFSITENSTAYGVNYDENVLYGVQSSPTLVINGAEVKTGRDPAAMLKAVCSAFTVAPAECSAALSSVTPSAGFGYSGAGDSGAAQCNG